MTPEPERLMKSDSPLGRALKDLPEPPVLSQTQVDRIRVATLAVASTSLLVWLATKWPLKLLLLVGVLGAGALVARGFWPEETPPAPIVLAASTPLPLVVVAPPVILKAPPPLPAAVAVVPHVRAPVRVVKPVEPIAEVQPEPVVEAPPPTSPESEEVKLLAQSHLANREHDVPRALRQLDLYRSRFPSGILSEEATLLEVELRLASHDEPKALALLNQILTQSTRRRPEFLLVRSELLAGLNRCDEALVGFKELLNAELPLQERAWFGVATCQLHSGNREPARTALEEYLRRFPKGAQRALAAELLKDN